MVIKVVKKKRKKNISGQFSSQLLHIIIVKHNMGPSNTGRPSTVLCSVFNRDVNAAATVQSMAVVAGSHDEEPAG